MSRQSVADRRVFEPKTSYTRKNCSVFMTQENTIKERIRQEIMKVAPELRGYRVFLFGSRATGNARERSDFDVGILGDAPVPLQTFYRIDDLLENIETLYKIDFVDLNRAAPSLKREALKAVEPLFDG